MQIKHNTKQIHQDVIENNTWQNPYHMLYQP